MLSLDSESRRVERAYNCSLFTADQQSLVVIGTLRERTSEAVSATRRMMCAPRYAGTHYHVVRASQAICALSRSTTSVAVDRVGCALAGRWVDHP